MRNIGFWNLVNLNAWSLYVLILYYLEIIGHLNDIEETELINYMLEILIDLYCLSSTCRVKIN